MPGTDLTVPPTAIVPGPLANYETVTINANGKILIYAQTNVTITTLVKN